MSIIFFGTPEFAIPSLRLLVEEKEDVVLVITQPDRAKGRGHKLTPPPVKVLANRMGIEVAQPLSLKDNELIERLSRIKPEFIIVVAYGKILSKIILDMPLRGCINLHASLLPKYRGAAPIQWAIIRGEKKTGICTMLMDEGLDTGPLLLMRELRIEEEDNAVTLSKKLSETGARLLIETIDGIRKGTVKPIPQVGEPSYAPPLTREDGLIDWNKSAMEIFNLIRGTYPWPGAFCTIGSERVKLIKAKPINNLDGHPGIIEKITKDELIIGTGMGHLSILELQPSGRSPMTVRDFLQGRNLTKGSRL